MGRKKDKKKGSNNNNTGFEVDDSGQMHFAQNIGEARDSYNTNRDQLRKDEQDLKNIQTQVATSKSNQANFDKWAREADANGNKESAEWFRGQSKKNAEYTKGLEAKEKAAQSKVDSQRKKTEFAGAGIRMDGTFNPEGQQIYLDAEQARKDERAAWEEWQETRKPLREQNARVKQLEEEKEDLWQKHCAASKAGDQDKADEYFEQWEDKREEVRLAKDDQAEAVQNYKDKKAALDKKTEERKEAEKKERASHRSQPKQQSQPADDKGKWYSTKNEDKPKKDNRPNDWVY